MLKVIFILSAAACLASPCVYAQRGGHNSAHSFGNSSFGRSSSDHRGGGHEGGHYGGRGGDHDGHNGHYYYFGGVPYFYPFYDVGFGYPYYGYGYESGFGYPGEAPDGLGPYGDQPYEGKIDRSGGGQNGPSLPAVVQQQLSKRGYYKGAIDGKFGPRSRNALSRFQHANGLQETGRIDEVTLMALGFADHR